MNRFDDEKLDGIKKDFINQCESSKTFPFRYYYVKYLSFRPGSYGKMGKMADDDNAKEHYRYAVMQTRSYYSENTYIPYLMEADPDKVDRDENGLYLTYDNHYISSWNDCYEVFEMKDDADEDELVDTITISQNEDDIDTEDRIIKLKDYLKEHKNL